MSNMIKLSGVVITLNEEDNIDRCLTSLKKVTDDIVVVDSFSTDRTEAICLEHGVRFIKHKYESAISQVKYVVEKAKYDDILLLDADEELSPELEKSILKMKSNPTASGYSIRFRTLFCDKWLINSWRHRVVRLFNRVDVLVGGVEPHYNFEPQNGAKIINIKGDILHHAYYRVEDFVAKKNGYSTRFAMAAFNRGKKAPIYKLLISPLWNFFRNYIIHLGFLDGAHGLTVCMIDAHYIFLKYAKLRIMNKKK